MKRRLQEVLAVFFFLLAPNSTLTFADTATSHSLALILTLRFFLIHLIAAKTSSQLQLQLQLAGQRGFPTFELALKKTCIIARRSINHP